MTALPIVWDDNPKRKKERYLMTTLLPTAALAALISLGAASDSKTDKPAAAQLDKPAATSPAAAQVPTSAPASETAVTVDGAVITEGQVAETFERACRVGAASRPAPDAHAALSPPDPDMLIDDQLFQAQATRRSAGHPGRTGQEDRG